MRRWLVALLVLVLGLPLLADTDRSQDEIALGRQLSQQFERKHHLISGDSAHLNRLEQRLVPVTGRPDLVYRVSEVDTPDINAITFPGGFIYVFRGLMEQHFDDDELAGVLGHETAHAVRSHGYKKLLGISVLDRIDRRFLHHGIDQGSLSRMIDILLVTGVGRRMEYEADYYGVQYAASAGFEPHGLLRVLKLFAHLETSHPSQMSKLLATHPPAADRVVRVEQELREMGIRP
ncbi:MAG: M48 family metalloprotease [Candidatus Xenobia bacterium]